MTLAQEIPVEKTVEIKRHMDASFLNQVINHPKVRPWIEADPSLDVLDMSYLTDNPNNICLMGDHGGVLYHMLQPGLYEAHTQVLPEGRGHWTVDMVRKTLHYMFTRTDAVEILTRVPKNNTPALALTKRIDGEYQFTRPNGDIYALSVQNWMRKADTTKTGRWVDNKIKKELRKQKIEFLPTKDENVDRYIGACIEMIFAGQIGKGIALYNRWASVAGYSSARVVAEAPLAVDFRGIMLIFRGTDFWVIPCR